jgi:hypothetical protein
LNNKHLTEGKEGNEELYANSANRREFSLTAEPMIGIKHGWARIFEQQNKSRK